MYNCTQQLREKQEGDDYGHRDDSDHKEKRSHNIFHQNITSAFAARVASEEGIQTGFLVIPFTECFLTVSTLRSHSLQPFGFNAYK